MISITSAMINFYLDPTTPFTFTELIDIINQTELEIEEINNLDQLDNKVVFAKIIEVNKLPNSEKIQQCLVDDGVNKNIVLTGSPYVEIGQYVAYAKNESILPNGAKIVPKKIIGQLSHGMLCGADEIGLIKIFDTKIINFKDYLPIEILENIKLGTPIKNLKHLDPERIIDIKTHPNRFEHLGVYWLAKYFASLAGKKLKNLELLDLKQIPIKIISNPNPNLAKDLIYVEMDLESNQQLPNFIEILLKFLGAKSVSPIVDISNFVMYELAQPSHCFGLSNINDISYRLADPQESLTILDGKTKKLTSDDIVVVDAENTESILGLAGVMGGIDSGVNNLSQRVILELAAWNPSLIRASAIRHGCRSEASSRFEKDLPPQLLELALQRILMLFTKYLGAKINLITTTRELFQPITESSIILEKKLLKIYFGEDFEIESVILPLTKLGFRIKSESENGYEFIVPWNRTDIIQGVDLIEEYLHFVGVDWITPTLPKALTHANISSQLIEREFDIIDNLIMLGFNQVQTNAFDQDSILEKINWDNSRQISIINPISPNFSRLKDNNLFQLMKILEDNHDYLNHEASGGIFEIARIFQVEQGEVRQDKHLSLVWNGPDCFSKVAEVWQYLAQRFLNLRLEISSDDKINDKNQTLFNANNNYSIIQEREVIGVLTELNYSKQMQLAENLTHKTVFLELDLEKLTEKKYQTIQKNSELNISRDVNIKPPKLWQDYIRNLVNEFQEQEFLAQINNIYPIDYYPESNSMTVRIIFDLQNIQEVSKIDSWLKNKIENKNYDKYIEAK